VTEDKENSESQPTPAFVDGVEGGGAPGWGEEESKPLLPDVPVLGETGLSRKTLEGARQRNPAALELFFDFFFEPLYALAFRLTGQRAMAEDLLQETFLRAYKAIDRLDTSRDPAPWLMTIAYNAFRDRWRSWEGRRERASLSIEGSTYLHEVLPGGEPSPEQHYLREELEQLVQDAITRLPLDLRAVVVMHDYLGLGHIEIAEITKISHGAVRKRYSRALKTLAKELGGKLP
jgi:RNA polymerase sigma-70 factor (ECF subfamily)